MIGLSIDRPIGLRIGIVVELPLVVQTPQSESKRAEAK